ISGIELQEIYRDLRITQLGQDIPLTGQLSDKGIGAVLDALAEFVQVLRHFQVDEILCVATSAVRDAANANVLIEGATSLGIEVEVAPGKVEAQLAFLGATYGLTQKASDKPVLVIDVGGGSTELVLGRVRPGGKTEILKVDSFQMGARRIADMFIDCDPPSAAEIKGIRSYLEQIASYELKQYVGQFGQVIAVAGTATTLAAVLNKVETYNSKEIQGKQVTREDMDALLQLFRSKPLEERQKITGLEPKRAGVIIAGMLVLESVMTALDCKQFFASDRDLLYGVLIAATEAATRAG
ncbi:MAG: hypothetical protein FWD93_04030, partial [Coriobacteriia bacterium]|nr:hypothetical protein [Coriobacteriia bacterium]